MNRTSCISQAYGILTSMCARVCIKVPVWKDHESLEWMEEYFFFFYMILCIYESEKDGEKTSIDL